LAQIVAASPQMKTTPAEAGAVALEGEPVG
jgi:hypothetical protein